MGWGVGRETAAGGALLHIKPALTCRNKKTKRKKWVHLDFDKGSSINGMNRSSMLSRVLFGEKKRINNRNQDGRKNRTEVTNGREGFCSDLRQMTMGT